LEKQARPPLSPATGSEQAREALASRGRGIGEWR
jgi:hypothetical protein